VSKKHLICLVLIAQVPSDQIDTHSRGSNPRSTALASLIITPPMRFGIYLNLQQVRSRRYTVTMMFLLILQKTHFLPNHSMDVFFILLIRYLVPVVWYIMVLKLECHIYIWSYPPLFTSYCTTDFRIKCKQIGLFFSESWVFTFKLL
jgi:hypothetical protein